MFKRFQIMTAAIATLAVALAGFVPSAIAVNVIWTGAIDTDWSDAGNWNAPIPGTGDGAFIIDGALTTATVSVDVDLINGPVDVIHVGQGAGDGAIEIAAGGNLTSTGAIFLGTDTGRVGTLTMSGGTLTAASFVAGNDSNSSATLTGGTLTVSGALTVAATATAGGSSVTQSGGSLSADFDGDGDVDGDDLTHPTLGLNARYGVDLDGSDFLSWQRQFGMSGAGGTSTVVVDRLDIGVGAAGVYNISSGTLTANNAGGADFSAIGVGVASQGTFNHSGGTVNHQAVHLSISKLAGSDGSAYNLSGTGILNVNNGGLLIIGNSGTGSFNQSGGTANLSSTTLVGRNSVGTLDVSGGTFNTSFIEIAGTSAGSTGSAVIQSGGTINTPAVGIGSFGAGSYTMTGGTLEMGAGSIIQVGNDPGASGSTLSVSGGTINVESINPGAFAQGTMTVSGTADVNVSGNMQISAAAGSGGSSVVQTGGALDANTVFVGVSGGIGTYDMSGGTLTLAGGLRVSENAAAGGSSVTHSGGDIVSASTLTVGHRASGSYNQTGGTITAGRIDIGGDAGVPGNVGDGVYNISAGTVNGGVDSVGAVPLGSGALNLSGAASYTSTSMIVGDNLLLGSFNGTLAGKDPGGTGVLSIDGSNVALSVAGVWIGQTGTLEVVADASGISTIVTTGGAHVLGGGTFLIGDLDIDLSALASNADLTLIDNTDNIDASVLGTFAGLAEGATFTDSSGTKDVTITYVGGVGGNDVLLTNITDIPALAGAAVPEPASAMMLLVGLAGLVSARRRRSDVA